MTWGLTNTFKYKNFDLSMLITGQAGGKIYGLLGRAIDRTGMGPAGNVMKRWVNAFYEEEYLDSQMKSTYSWDGKTPLLVGGTNSTTYYTTDWLYSSDFVKIKNITLRGTDTTTSLSSRRTPAPAPPTASGVTTTTVPIQAHAYIPSVLT